MDLVCYGTYCFNFLSKLTNIKVNLYSHRDIDICNKKELEPIIANSDYIINCAAYTNVDNAEVNQSQCINVNALAVEDIAKLCVKYNTHLVHISSDFVYGDVKYKSTYEELIEEDCVNPINVYGKSKLDGELNILKWMSRNFLILRVSWTFGITGNNFISKIYQQLYDQNVKQLNVVDDQLGRPTSIKLISYVISQYINGFIKYGFYNLSNSGQLVSKYEIAEFIKQQIKINKKINRVKTSDYKSPAKRQLNSNLNCLKLDKLCVIIRPDWKVDVRDYLSELEKQKAHNKCVILFDKIKMFIKDILHV